MIRLNEEFIPPPKPSRDDRGSIPELIRSLKNGERAEKEVALLQLIIIGAEHELSDCLTCPDPLTATLATAGLWECWLNEEGPDARTAIDQAIDLMGLEALGFTHRQMRPAIAAIGARHQCRRPDTQVCSRASVRTSATATGC